MDDLEVIPVIDSNSTSSIVISNSEVSIEQVESIRSICVSPQPIPVVSPGGTKEWIPNSSPDSKPQIGMRFSSVEDGIVFYKDYAVVAGFNMRKSTCTKLKRTNIVNFQYCLCNKAGFKLKYKSTVQEAKHSTSRQRLVTRVGCKARMILKYCNDNGGCYVVTAFHEGHTHPLYTPGCAKFQKGGRQMNILHKKFIVDNSKVNIGPSKTFRMLKEYVGGYENVGASKQDFKNFQRDLKAYIEGSDAQMFVDNFKMKKLLWSAFFFDFEVDDEDCLCRALWADPICRKNYALFGDMVSFDTTFKTNKYNMIFGPFTGVDNHKRCVTFAASFIAKEDIVSFEWVFSTFLKAMDLNEPTCLITDQDPAMKIAIGNVFQKTEHRYCMWHIMKKMPEKIGRSIIQDTDFLEKICACVWSDDIEPEEFEMRWNKIIYEFGLDKHAWLKSLYDIRELWIPAYFRDLFLGGLMRTTSRSESENSFFTAFTNPHLTLVEFYMRFESSMDSQRHIQSNKDNDSEHKRPECKTPMSIEKHGADVYTTSVFYAFQAEVHIACFCCGLESLQKENDIELFTLKEGRRLRNLQILFDFKHKETKCSCKMWDRQGLPCSHMIWVWNSKMINMIPEQYVLERWMKTGLRKSTYVLDSNVIAECADMVEKKRLLNCVWSEIHSCVSLAQGDQDGLVNLITTLQNFRISLQSKRSGSIVNSAASKIQDIEILIGASTPSEIAVKPPKISKNKGTGVHVKNANKDKRYKSAYELGIEESHKKKRLCRGCGEVGFHDIRNCPHKKVP